MIWARPERRGQLLGASLKLANRLAALAAGAFLAFATVVTAAPAGTAPAAEQVQSAAQVQATSISIVAEKTSTIFQLELDRGVPAEIYTLANPYRVIIDLPDVAFRLPAGTGQQGQGLIKAYRFGLFAEQKSRIVIDTDGPVRIAKAGMVNAPKAGAVILKVDLAVTDAQTFGAGTGAEPKKEEAAAIAAKPNPRTNAKPVIVIDPGHGGIDPGASGLNNMSEKALVLAVAQQLKAALSKTGTFDVRMTRSSDVFVSLDRRLKFSSENNADLFISLHADAIAETNVAEGIRGATVYTLSERASDEQARRMAEKENASDAIAGLQGGQSGENEQVRNILIDLLKRETSNFSADFSNVLVSRLSKSIAMSKDPQRSAAFKVLKQTHAPSVLVELGYMSNSKDQQEMATAPWQGKVAASIAAAVTAYFAKRTAEHP